METKKTYLIKCGLFITLFLLVSSITFAQLPVNFSGSWTFNESKSDLGEGSTRMVSQKLTIVQDEKSFNLERTYTGQDGEERKLSETYTLDGKESVNPVFNTSKKSTAVWSADKKSLTVSSVLVFEMNGEQIEIKSIEQYKYSDSKDLIIDSQTTSTRGDRKAILVYNKN